jgi:hypothetical protein
MCRPDEAWALTRPLPKRLSAVVGKPEGSFGKFNPCCGAQLQSVLARGNRNSEVMRRLSPFNGRQRYNP